MPGRGGKAGKKRRKKKAGQQQGQQQGQAVLRKSGKRGGGGGEAEEDDDGLELGDFDEDHPEHGENPKQRAERQQQISALMQFTSAYGQLSELVARRLFLVKKEEQEILSLQDISDHVIYLHKVVDELNEEKEQIVKKHKITEAMLRKAKQPHRIRQLNAQREGIRKREKQYNANVAVLNSEREWLRKTPAFLAAHKHVIENWEETPSGKWVNKLEMAEDEKVSFDDLLAQMKDEDEAVPQGKLDRGRGGPRRESAEGSMDGGDAATGDSGAAEAEKPKVEMVLGGPLEQKARNALREAARKGCGVRFG